MGDRWGPEGPPEEAYSRVTNPERFAPLHDDASGMLDRLEAEFDVEAEAGYGLDPELEASELARPSRRLVPRDPRAAPIAIAFTTFPGVIARFGRWMIEPFPSCGCDACDETAEEESSRLSELIEATTAGYFSESLRVPRMGDGWLAHRFGSPGRWSRGGEGMINRRDAKKMLLRGEPSSHDWSPWTRLTDVRQR